MKRMIIFLCAAFLLLAFTVGCAAGRGYRSYGSIKLESGWTRDEAENPAVASIHNSARVNDVPPGTEPGLFFSGGKAAGAIDKRGNVKHIPPDFDWTTISEIGYVKFTVTVPEAGRYLAKILYNGDDDDKYIMVKINNEPHKIVSLPQREDGQWDIVHARQTDLQLDEGENIVWVSGVIGHGWANIDCIDIRETPLPPLESK